MRGGKEAWVTTGRQEAPRTGEGPQLSPAPAHPPGRGVSRAPREGPRAVGHCPLRLAPTAYLGTCEHSGVPRNTRGMAQGQRQAGRSKCDRLGISEEPCHEGKGGAGPSGHSCATSSFSCHPGGPVTRRPILQMGPLTLSVATCVCGVRARPVGHHEPVSRSLMRARGPATHLDPLNALGDDVSVAHGHQRDLDTSHPAHSARPHPCGQSTGS